MPERPENTGQDKDEVATKEEKAALRVWRCANLAVQLANLTQVGRQVAVEPTANITKLCWSKVSEVSKGEEQHVEMVREATAEMNTEDWTARYKKWCDDVFANKESKTPNELQAQILHLVHDRRHLASLR